MKKILFIILFALCAALPAQASDKAPNEVYKRVAETRTLRCAYTLFPPYFAKDPNTGAFSGFSYEFTEALGKQMGVKIEWTEEVGPDTIFEGFKGGRYDAVCLGYAQTPSRAWGGDFSKPFVFFPFYLYVRADENRFKTFSDLNNESVRFATLDGEMSQMVAREDFPKAKEISLQGMTSFAERLEMVATNKVDATGIEADSAYEYMKNNPGKIKLFSATPVRMQGATIVIPHDEFQLKRMIDIGIDATLWTGELEKILKRNLKAPGSMILPAKDYETPN